MSLINLLNVCSGGRVVGTSVSHQCGLGLIPGWGSDSGAISEKGFVLVWATLHPWVGTLNHWPSLSTITNPIQGASKNSQTSRKEKGNHPGCCNLSSSIYTIYTNRIAAASGAFSAFGSISCRLMLIDWSTTNMSSMSSCEERNKMLADELSFACLNWLYGLFVITLISRTCWLR